MAEVTRAEFDDAAAAIRLLAKRLTKAEEGVSVSVLTISTLVELIQEIDPAKMDKKLRELRLWVQNSEAGRTGSELTKLNRDQLNLLEKALGPYRQRSAEPKAPPTKED